MTRCCRDGANVKSSVYNQTGQSYMDQVSLHRSMCTHLRRVLLAKSVVDSRNPRFARIQLQRRCTARTAAAAAATSTPSRASSCKLSFFQQCPSEETIDKLAYDTEHHPCDIMKVHCRSKSSSNEEPNYSDANCSCRRETATAKRCSKPSLKAQLQRPDESKDITQLCPWKCCPAKSRKCKYHEASWPEPEPEPTERGERSSPQKRSEPEARLDKLPRQCSGAAQEEEALYAKFVYDITQEIVQNALYTDRELKQVFQKHLDRCSGCLNKRKMLYEIYQLKISLNMLDDSEEEEEDEVEADLVYAEKFPSQRVPKPPTPPKILNENKLIEKLDAFRQLRESAAQSALSTPRCNKSVVLVDANPEFLVTERDVLSSLVDNDVEPHQIEKIYRNLFRRSKDMSLCEAVQVGSEVAYAHRLKVDKGTSAASLGQRDRSHGILRKDTWHSAGRLSCSPYLKNRQSEAMQKCASWKVEQCDCSATELVRREEKAARKEVGSCSKKINFAADGQPRKAKRDAQRLAESWEQASDVEQQSKAGEQPDSARSQVPEEIEEDIESEAIDKSEHEEKELASVREEDEDQQVSSNESLEYSDDFSNASESSRESRKEESKSSKAQACRRYSSMREYFDSFATVGDQKIWRISEGSSSSSSISSASAPAEPPPCQRRSSSSPGRVIKKRTSSGMNGFKAIDSWNKRLSELSSDFYVQNGERCRQEPGKTCADGCPFTKTKCRQHYNRRSPAAPALATCCAHNNSDNHEPDSDSSS